PAQCPPPDLPPQNLAHALRHDAAKHVGRTSGRERNDHRDRFGGIRLGQCRPCHREQQAEGRARNFSEHFLDLPEFPEPLPICRMRVKSLFDAGFPVLVSEDRAGYDPSSTAGDPAGEGPPMPVIRVAIAGLGAIGRVLARSLADGIPGLVLAGAAARDVAKAQAWLDAEQITCPLVQPEAFPALADLAIECAPASVLERICRPMLEAGKQVMVLSAGAL